MACACRSGLKTRQVVDDLGFEHVCLGSAGWDLESRLIVDELQLQCEDLSKAWSESMWLVAADLGSGKQINCGRAATTMGAGAEQEGAGALLCLHQLVRRWLHPLLWLHRRHHPRLGSRPCLEPPQDMTATSSRHRSPEKAAEPAHWQEQNC